MDHDIHSSCINAIFSCIVHDLNTLPNKDIGTRIRSEWNKRSVSTAIIASKTVYLQ